jgi:hypothetical protein
MPKEAEFHVGPHITNVGPHENRKKSESFSRDGSDGQIFAAHPPNRHDLNLVIPFRELSQQ